jgi:hypothetical protein
MRILKYFSVCIITMIAMIIITGCGDQIPRTPREAFQAAGDAYSSGDSAMMVKLLSKETLGSYTKAIRTINAMSPDRKKSLYAKKAIPSESNIGLREFTAFTIETAKRDGNIPAFESLSRPITSIVIKDNRAVVRTDNGIELHFVKEGFGWKFNPEAR